jgi:hypothetical protein
MLSVGHLEMASSPDDPDRTVTRHTTAAADTWSPGGPVVVGGYALVRELGRGGMGVVYEALEPGARRTVALKVLDVAGGGYDLDLALREARLMAKVSHPNTVFLYRAERTDSGLLLVMEVVRGGTLADLLRREGRLPVPVAIALQLIAGFRAYDAHGIVHRDIKPSNCFLDPDGRARIGDLGLSRSPETASRMTREGRFLGTPHDSPPEQLRGEAVDRRSDIYSLGATLYEMIAGRPPIDAPDGVTLVARIITEEPAPLSTRVPGIPPGLDEAVLRALAKRPEGRYSTYDEFAEVLAPFTSSSLPVAEFWTRVAASSGDIILIELVGEGLVRIGAADRPLAVWISIGLIATYFLLFETVGRASPIKRSLGLRIVARDGGRAGLTRALPRALFKIDKVIDVRHAVPVLEYPRETGHQLAFRGELRLVPEH